MRLFLCLLLALPSASTDNSGARPLQQFVYSSQIMANFLKDFGPPEEVVEVRIGWQRIYMGATVYGAAIAWNLGVKFKADPNTLSSVAEVKQVTPTGSLFPRTSCVEFRWFVANVPGDDVSRGDVITPREPHRKGLPGFSVVLVIPQEDRLDPNVVRQFFAQERCHFVKNVTSTFKTEDPVAINAFHVYAEACAGTEKFTKVPEDGSRDWAALMGNMKLLPQKSDYLWKIPTEKLEVDFEGDVPVLFGNCIETFLTAMEPTAVRFKAVPGHYYALTMHELHNIPSNHWLRINIPDADFRRGQDIFVFQNPPDTRASAFYLFLLFSQGTRTVTVQDPSKILYKRPNNLSQLLQLGDPVAANFFLSVSKEGVPPPPAYKGLTSTSPSRSYSTKSTARIAPGPATSTPVRIVDTSTPKGKDCALTSVYDPYVFFIIACLHVYFGSGVL